MHNQITNSPQDLLADIESFQVRYSTFWQRFMAILVDSLVLIPVVIIDTFNKITWKNHSVFILSFLITLTYKPLLESKYGASLGKMALNLKIVNTKYQKAETKNIILRNIFGISGRILTGAVALI